MAFLIPSKFDESNLPIPDNTSVKIRRVPSKTVAVTAFSGTNLTSYLLSFTKNKKTGLDALSVVVLNGAYYMYRKVK